MNQRPLSPPSSSFCSNLKFKGKKTDSHSPESSANHQHQMTTPIISDTFHPHSDSSAKVQPFLLDLDTHSNQLRKSLFLQSLYVLSSLSLNCLLEYTQNLWLFCLIHVFIIYHDHLNASTILKHHYLNTSIII